MFDELWSEIADAPGEIFDIFTEEDRQQAEVEWQEIQQENEEPGWDLYGFAD